MFKRLGAFFLDILEVIVFAIGIFFFVYLLVMRPHKIKGQSMHPNYPDGEYLLTQKVSYYFHGPERGDVVVFKPPISEEDEFIKRINMPNAKKAFLSTIISNRGSKISCEKLANVSVPSLVIWGEHDPVIPKENANMFFSCIKNCQFVEMKKCGHTPFVEEPEKFSKIVLEFLELTT